MQRADEIRKWSVELIETFFSDMAEQGRDEPWTLPQYSNVVRQIERKIAEPEQQSAKRLLLDCEWVCYLRNLNVFDIQPLTQERRKRLDAAERHAAQLAKFLGDEGEIGGVYIKGRDDLLARLDDLRAQLRGLGSGDGETSTPFSRPEALLLVRLVNRLHGITGRPHYGLAAEMVSASVGPTIPEPQKTFLYWKSGPSIAFVSDLGEL